MSSTFDTKKQTILRQLAAPSDSYSDLSPKGSIDEPIRVLIDEINGEDGLVTTSSCSGRISVFLEGQKKNTQAAKSTASSLSPPVASAGGKGGGSWLFVSHDPIKPPVEQTEPGFLEAFTMKPRESTVDVDQVTTRFVHLKFEAMILHILTASVEHAQRVVTTALAAGFRESGAVGLSSTGQRPSNPIVAIRSTGLSFDAVIGYESSDGQIYALVDETYLRILIGIANDRFSTNLERIARFRQSLFQHRVTQNGSVNPTSGGDIATFEDPQVRRERKRKEGLKLQEQTLARKIQQQHSNKDEQEN